MLQRYFLSSSVNSFTLASIFRFLIIVNISKLKCLIKKLDLDVKEHLFIKSNNTIFFAYFFILQKKKTDIFYEHL